MIAAASFEVGQKVKDDKLGLVWKIVRSDPDGTVYIRRKGVTAFAWPGDLEPL